MSFDPQSTYMPTCPTTGCDMDECPEPCCEPADPPFVTLKLALESIVRWCEREESFDPTGILRTVAQTALRSV